MIYRDSTYNWFTITKETVNQMLGPNARNTPPEPQNTQPNTLSTALVVLASAGRAF